VSNEQDTISQGLLAEVIESQNTFWIKEESSIKREKLTEVKVHDGFTRIITGIRRCGKSTLLRQLLPQVSGKTLFLNFEDPRLSGFEKDDFRRLDNELKPEKSRISSWTKFKCWMAGNGMCGKN